MTLLKEVNATEIQATDTSVAEKPVDIQKGKHPIDAVPKTLNNPVRQHRNKDSHEKGRRDKESEQHDKHGSKRVHADHKHKEPAKHQANEQNDVLKHEQTQHKHVGDVKMAASPDDKKVSKERKHPEKSHQGDTVHVQQSKRARHDHQKRHKDPPGESPGSSKAPANQVSPGHEHRPDPRKDDKENEKDE